jgi:hypothetical protein
MGLRTPVIASGWSDNMTCMDSTSAALVDHTLVPVDGNSVVLSRKSLAGPDARWAAPDVAVATRWMRVQAEDPG